MAYSHVYYNGDGTTQTFAVPFSVLKRNEVKVQVDGVVLSSGYTVNSGATTVTITTPPPAGTGNVKVFRVTTISPDDTRPVDFQNGSRVRAEDADRAVLHLLHAAQEARDRADDALQELAGDPTKWNGENKELLNVGAPVALDSAVRLRDLQAIQQVAGNLPIVSGANENAGLFVSGGSWGVRTPAEARVHLGLANSAVTPYGTAPRNLVILDNDARLPAIDGRNLTNLDLNASVIAAVAAGGGGGGSSVPTVNLWYTSSVVLNSTGATWNTDSSGSLGRLDVSASQPFAEAFNDIPGGGGTKYITYNVSNNLVTLNIAGKYEVEFDVVLGNRDTVVSGNVTVLLARGDGVPLWTSGGGQTLGPRAASAWAGEKLVIRRKIFIDLATSTPFTICLKAVHASTGGAVWCLGDGTQLSIRKVS